MKSRRKPKGFFLKKKFLIRYLEYWQAAKAFDFSNKRKSSFLLFPWNFYLSPYYDP